MNKNDLTEFILQVQCDARESIKYLESNGIGVNSPGVAMDLGKILACTEILDYILCGTENEDI